MSVPLLIDQNIGTATNIETMHDKSFLIHLVITIHDYSPFSELRIFFICLTLAITNKFYNKLGKTK